MKKLALLLALVLMASCSASAMALTISGPNEFPIVDEEITLTLWGGESVGRDYDTCVMTNYLEEYTGINIEWEQFSSVESGATMLNLLISGGEYPDIVMMGFSPQQVLMCVEAGLCIPLNDLIEEHGVNYKAMLEEQPAYESMLTALDGNIYTFAYTDTGVHKDCEYKMWYYEPWLEALGMEAPTTPEEFKEYLIAIRDNDVNGNGDPNDEIPLAGYYGGRKSDPICFLMNPFELYTDNYYYISDEGEIVFTAITDGWREGLAYIADLYAEGLIAEETYVQDQTQFRAMLNKPADEMIVGVFPHWYQGELIDTDVMDWTIYEPLAPLAGEKQQAAARFGGNFGLNCMITSQCENPEAAFKLLDYMLGYDGLILGHYGVEGECFEWVDEPSYYGDDRSIRRLVDEVEVLWNPGQFPRYDKAEIRYATTMDEEMITLDNTYVLVHGAEAYEPYYVNHNIPDIVWCTDTAVVQAVSDYSTLIGDYIKTMDTQFIMGQLDIHNDDEWQAYLDTLDSMGLQDYIANLEIYYGLK